MSEFFRQASPDLSEDVRRLLHEVDPDAAGAAFTAGCRPSLDILENTDSIEVVVDVPGVPIDSLKVGVRRTTVVVVGTKPAAPLDASARFHLAERSYGRFARAIQVAGAVDAARARAVVGDGQLRITLPLVDDRRGRILTIPVERS